MRSCSRIPNCLTDLQEDNIVFELTYSWDKKGSYDHGNGYAHVAISTNDVYKTAEAIRANGGKIVFWTTKIS
jgi:lactoylglutathione lyase